MDKKEKYNILFNVLVILIVGGLIFWNEYRGTMKLRNNHVYTTGVIDKFISQGRGLRFVHFRFKVSGKYLKGRNVYTGSREEEKKLILKKRFFVKYCPDDTDLSFIKLENPVLDSTLVPPKHGWKTIPNKR
jgi:hypothetical protein